MARVPIEPGLFTESPSPRLLAGRCGACAGLHFPASDVCPYCADESVSVAEVGSTGVIYLHTVVNTPPPGYEGPVPYGFGLVDLPEGLRVVSRLSAADLRTLASGAEVRLVVEPLFRDADGNDVVTWTYVPAAETQP